MTSKLPNIGTTIFSIMSALAAEHKALNVGQGFPSFPIDEAWSDLIKKYINQGLNQYAPMPGVPILREALARKIKNTIGVSTKPDTEITVTAGATQAIFTAITALIHPGDEAILFAPAYDCYAPAIELCGGVPVWINLHYPNYSVNWEQVQSAITDKTKMIIVNHPNNPAGTVFNKDDFEQLNRIAETNNLFVISDEVYEHIIFDNHPHLSALQYPYLRENTIATYSFGKTFHMTGWKLGYAVGSEKLMTEFRKVHQFNVFSVNTPAQYAVAEYLEDPSHYQDIPNFYQEKRDLFLSELKNPNLEITPTAGTYFQLINYSKLDRRDDTEVAIDWTKKYGITTIPCSVFYPNKLDEKVLRVCFAKDDETILQAARILNSIQ